MSDRGTTILDALTVWTTGSPLLLSPRSLVGPGMVGGAVHLGRDDGDKHVIADIRFDVKGRDVQATVIFDPQMVEINTIAHWVSAIWEAARTTGFPDSEWIDSEADLPLR